MKKWIARTLLRCYPAAWRREYGPELRDMLVARPLTLGILGDVLWNGMRQRIRVVEPPTLAGLAMMLIVLIGFDQPLTSNVSILILVGCGWWTHLRHGGELSRSGSAAVMIAFIAGLPVMLGILGTHATQDHCWIRVAQPATQQWAQAIQAATCPPARLGVVLSPLSILPASWLWGLLGGALGRRFSRV